MSQKTRMRLFLARQEQLAEDRLETVRTWNRILKRHLMQLGVHWGDERNG